MAFIKSSFSSSAAFGWVDFVNHNFQRCASFGSFGRCPLCTHCAVLWWWLTWQWNRCSGSGACFFRTIRLTMAQVCRVCSKTQRNEFNQLFLKVANGVITFMWAAGSGGQHYVPERWDDSNHQESGTERPICCSYWRSRWVSVWWWLPMLLLFLQGCIGWFPPVVWERLACRLLFWTPFLNDFRAGCHCGRWSAFLLSRDVSPCWPRRNTGSWADSWAAWIGIGSLARVEWGKKLQVIFCLVCFFSIVFPCWPKDFVKKYQSAP